MSSLKDFSQLNIDWNLSPEHAVTMYLEWGNNDWHAEHPPVRSKDDFAHYFVVDTWGESPIIRLVRRNSENAVELISVPLPDSLKANYVKEYGNLRGVFEPTQEIKAWIKSEMGH
ncbi:DVU0772 family protein [Desulfovibrio litoralis]|uniref:Uncharacterized protein n=1 Tax=Desulfovibrio litoralis DSM 11393 TaxID=1121455 RepID=A0A1M7SP09_9BACT|nr:hypothetical protein [Desulfovibrio litoralis]SHN60164.1 hypothetical protein SAMN02745728_01090 [Desulfovibrio litoralis DSM 11393]